jgi:hypothetical protein
MGDLQGMPLGLVQGVHEPADELLLVAVFAAADGGHGDLQDHLPRGRHPDFQEGPVLGQFRLENAQGQFVGETRKLHPRPAEVLVATHDPAADHAFFADQDNVDRRTIRDVDLHRDDGADREKDVLNGFVGSEDQLTCFQTHQLERCKQFVIFIGIKLLNHQIAGWT